MGIVLGFLPFLAFAVLSAHVGALVGQVAAAAVSAVLIARARLAGQPFKILEVGTLVLFAALAVYMAMASQPLSIFAVRLCVDAGLLAIVLISMLVGRPFTLQYARAEVPPEFWSSPRFIRANYVITGAWALVFLALVAIEAIVVVYSLPTRLGTVLVVIALLCGIGFTRWYAKAQD